ncbi:cytochrome P450 [Aspergillus alliaceus]|uniref:Cytochrome P450 n=1 Tax=Petromyces alliaceus TaxID=209559 RepID=A0A5N7C7N1_PETAA|nr:cytochrome P450 [Aspergillus alliaceus]
MIPIARIIPSVPSLATLGVLATCALIFYALGNVVYNLWFHPLRQYPGSRFDAATRLPYTFHYLRGSVTQRTKRLHDEYGHVVRIAPNTLSYTCSEAWDDIYGLKQSSMRGNFPKDPKYYIKSDNDVSNISNANDRDHRWLRRIQAHAFSEKAISLQQAYIQKHVDLFISRLGDEIGSTRKGIINAVQWFTYLTTDIIGELAFGENFDEFRKVQMFPWFENLHWTVKSFAFFRELSRYPRVITYTMMFFMTPRSRLFSQWNAIDFGKELAGKRMKRGADQVDFMSYILRHNDERTLSDVEIAVSSITFMIAGSETTATLMSGLAYLLLKNPSTLQKLTAVIRRDFPDSTGMTFLKLQKHDYINAVLSEALRLYPPAPDSLFRVAPAEGGLLAGKFIPPGTSVTVNLFAAFRSPLNFHRPNEFIPERWLKDSPPEFQSDKRSVFQPFSTGTRSCLGKNLAWVEMRVILAHLLWHYNVEELMPDSTNWIEQQKIYTFWEKPGLNIRISKRD